MIACKKGMKDAIKVLLNTGADPNAADADGNTCLHYTARNDCCTEILQTIINHGADVNATDKKKVTALMLACGNGNEDAITILLNAGADTNIADANGNTCLYYVAYGNCSKCVLQSIISHGADVKATDKYEQTSLMFACLMKNENAINVLLSAGADPKLADSLGVTCLQYAVDEGYSKHVFDTIMNHGADVNAANMTNITALMLACANLNIYAINVLLNAGAEPNIADVDGNTCLHYAARNHCCAGVLQAVISHGGDVNATNKNNVTALMLACAKGNKDAINVLLDAGTYSNIADANGDTCLHYTARKEFCTEVLQAIISHGADVNATNKENETALMIACVKGNKDTTNILLNAGANPNIADADGNTCLHNAVGKSCIADHTIAAYEGYTCLH